MTTPPAPAADSEWDDALAGVATGLDELDRVLAADDWSATPTPSPVAVTALMPARLAPTARSLVSRLAAMQQRLADELARTRSALDDLGARRTAARNYTQSATITSARRSTDD